MYVYEITVFPKKDNWGYSYKNGKTYKRLANAVKSAKKLSVNNECVMIRKNDIDDDDGWEWSTAPFIKYENGKITKRW